MLLLYITIIILLHNIIACHYVHYNIIISLYTNYLFHYTKQYLLKVHIVEIKTLLLRFQMEMPQVFAYTFTRPRSHEFRRIVKRKRWTEICKLNFPVNFPYTVGYPWAILRWLCRRCDTPYVRRNLFKRMIMRLNANPHFASCVLPLAFFRYTLVFAALVRELVGR